MLATEKNYKCLKMFFAFGFADKDLKMPENV
nr:MAG TPA: hypothetical protein [Caudoviricetes sp.]DAN06990.1 MAG TPA: hypothetical protein [Caudoviricetes sp.]